MASTSPSFSYLIKSEIINEKFDGGDMSLNRMYLRDMFLATGSMSNPEKGYHLEFVFSEESQALKTLEAMQEFSLKAKITKRSKNYVLYIKEGEDIALFLNIIGAHKSLLELENIRVIKDVSNNVNRVVNCETSNLRKTVNASLKQTEDIELIFAEKGEKYLEPNLRQLADLRLSYPNATLEEMGHLSEPKISKSCVNHRLRKISEIAKKIRNDE
ncbi:MAG: DNA-binding protein WhiA [Defluviitaleaceae bacterium]|nr:DNA-binding protein WhiA [Defluviitaleaceae bacterium]